MPTNVDLAGLQSGADLNDNSISASKLNGAGNGTSGQLLKSNGNGTFSWISASSGPGDVGMVVPVNTTLSFTVPDGVNRMIFSAVGGGGGGGPSQNGYIPSGGGGAYALWAETTVTAGESVSVTTANSISGRKNDQTPADGYDTTITKGSGNITLNGGYGGSTRNYSNGGLGGTISGTINRSFAHGTGDNGDNGDNATGGEGLKVFRDQKGTSIEGHGGNSGNCFTCYGGTGRGGLFVLHGFYSA